MTIDHVRELDVVLADGSRARLDSRGRGRVARAGPRATLEGAIYRQLPQLLRDERPAIAEGFPEFWRRAGGYRLDRLPRDGAAHDLAGSSSARKGTLVIVFEALVDLVPKPRRTVIAVGHFASTPAAIEATEDALSCEPAAVELMDRTILDLARKKIEYASRAPSSKATRRRCCSCPSPATTRRSCRPVDRLAALWKRHGHGYHTLRAITPAQQAPLLKVRQVGPRAC